MLGINMGAEMSDGEGTAEHAAMVARMTMDASGRERGVIITNAEVGVFMVPGCTNL